MRQIIVVSSVPLNSNTSYLNYLSTFSMTSYAQCKLWHYRSSVHFNASCSTSRGWIDNELGENDRTDERRADPGRSVSLSEAVQKYTGGKISVIYIIFSSPMSSLSYSAGSVKEAGCFRISPPTSLQERGFTQNRCCWFPNRSK